ncbi:MAG: GspH/FimT family pseudopilin [Methylophilaceae bacterium]|nr:GspH/FimT family pseudopilin [Methylophilaceae bacterium]
MLIFHHSLRQVSGVSLVELMIVIAVASILFFIGLPSVQDMMASTRTKTAAESILSGLRKAKSEAIKRNMPVRFQLVSSLSNGCAYSTTSMLWMVTETDQLASGDPVPNCGSAPRLFTSAAEVPPTVQINANASVVTFSPLGLVIDNMGGVARLAQVDITSSNPEATPWRVLVSSGGSIRMCNPGSAIAADNPMKCP